MKNTKKILVTGSRKLTDAASYKTLKNLLDELAPITIIHGGAVGVDSLAARYAESENIDTVVMVPDYEKHGKYAPLKRNTELVKLARGGVCVAMYASGRIRKGGTWDTVHKTLKAGLEVYEIMPDGVVQVTAPRLKLL